MGENNLAYQPVLVDAEDEDSFTEYWISVMYEAIVGELAKLSRMSMDR